MLVIHDSEEIFALLFSIKYEILPHCDTNNWGEEGKPCACVREFGLGLGVRLELGLGLELEG